MYILEGVCFMFFDVFNKLCAEKGISASRALLDLEMGKSSVTRWKNGGEPSNSTMKKIADYFGVSVDHLMTGYEQKEKLTINNNDKSKSKLRSIARLESSEIGSKEDEMIDKYIKFLLEEKNK
jgi:transcriptional regulator with XRE-family HTH domain